MARQAVCRPPPKVGAVCVNSRSTACVEAVAYEAMEARVDPLDPTTGFFLHRLVVDHYSRRRGTARGYWGGRCGC